MKRRDGAAGWLLSMPFLLLFVVFLVGPVVVALFYSLTDFTSRDVRNPLNVNTVWFENYIDLFSDRIFLQAFGNTVLYVVVSVPLTLLIGLALAVALNSALVRYKSVFRVGYYIPFVTSIVGISVMWSFLLSPESGLVNETLALVGIDGPDWLQDPATALPVLIFIVVWRNVGMIMVFFLAGLQSVPNEMLEAGAIDGASTWQRFRHLTLPVLRPTTLFAAVTMSLWTWQVFEEPYVMTQGGPLNTTASLSTFAFGQFGYGEYARSMAASYVLFAAILAGTVLLFRLLRPKV